MSSRRAFLAILAAMGAAWPASAALPPDIVGQVERYLNGIDTLRANFTQLAPDGTLSTGRVYIDRPGRMRFEYDGPEDLLLVASDWRLVMYDPKADQTTTIPVDRTPLGLLLAEDIRLAGDVTLRGLAEVNNELHVTVVQTAEPGQGELELVFGMNPLELRRWQVLDAQGKTTQVLLEDLETNVRLDRGLFTAGRN